MSCRSHPLRNDITFKVTLRDVEVHYLELICLDLMHRVRLPTLMGEFDSLTIHEALQHRSMKCKCKLFNDTFK